MHSTAVSTKSKLLRADIYPGNFKNLTRLILGGTRKSYQYFVEYPSEPVRDL
jgi:hypothetical protein